MSDFDHHFRNSPLASHRHERRGGGRLSTGLIRLDSPAHAVVDPPTDELVIGLVLAGSAGAHWSWDGAAENRTTARRVGSLGLTPIGSAGTFEVLGPSSILIVALPYPALARRLAHEMAVPRDFGPLHDAYVDRPRVRALCLRLWRAAGRASLGRDLLIDSLAERLLVELSEPNRDDRDDERFGVWECRRLSDAAVRAEADVVALADAVGMPIRSFRRRFGLSFGTTPQRWLARHRIDRARRLLEDRRHSISEIALDLGFASQAHFTAAFGRDVGVSPGRYRRDRLG